MGCSFTRFGESLTTTEHESVDNHMTLKPLPISSAKSVEFASTTSIKGFQRRLLGSISNKYASLSGSSEKMTAATMPAKTVSPNLRQDTRKISVSRLLYRSFSQSNDIDGHDTISITPILVKPCKDMKVSTKPSNLVLQLPSLDLDQTASTYPYHYDSSPSPKMPYSVLKSPALSLSRNMAATSSATALSSKAHTPRITLSHASSQLLSDTDQNNNTLYCDICNVSFISANAYIDHVNFSKIHHIGVLEYNRKLHDDGVLREAMLELDREKVYGSSTSSCLNTPRHNTSRSRCVTSENATVVNMSSSVGSDVASLLNGPSNVTFRAMNTSPSRASGSRRNSGSLRYSANAQSAALMPVSSPRLNYTMSSGIASTNSSGKYKIRSTNTVQ
jgi:hypothetical protein